MTPADISTFAQSGAFAVLAAYLIFRQEPEIRKMFRRMENKIDDLDRTILLLMVDSKNPGVRAAAADELQERRGEQAKKGEDE